MNLILGKISITVNNFYFLANSKLRKTKSKPKRTVTKASHLPRKTQYATFIYSISRKAQTNTIKLIIKNMKKKKANPSTKV